MTQNMESARVRLSLIIFVVIATVLGLFATIQTERATAHINSLVACLATYNNANNAVLKIRAKLTMEQTDLDAAFRKDTAEFLGALAKANGSQKAGAAAFATYIAQTQALQTAQDAINASKKANPIPDPPSEVCK